MSAATHVNRLDQKTFCYNARDSKSLPEPVIWPPGMTDRPEPPPGRNLPLPFGTGSGLPSVPPSYQPPVYYPEDTEAISLEHYLHVLLRRRWLLLAVAFTVIVLAALQVFTTTPMYQATARLQVDPEGSKVVPFQEVAGSEMAGGWFMENYMWTQTEILQSRGLAVRVVDKLGLADAEAFNTKVHPGALIQLKGLALKILRAPFELGRSSGGANQAGESLDPQTARLARRVAAGVDAQPVRNTRLIEVNYTAPDPQIAATVVNALTEEFIEQNLEGKFEATTRATDFLREQLEGLQIEVERSEQALLEYAQRNNIVNLSERETIARKRLADLSDERTAAETELITDQARYEAAKNASLDQFPESLKTESIRSLERRLSEAESELASFSSRYGPEWPAVKQTRIEIEDFERQLKAQRQEALSSARQQYQLTLDRHARLEAAVTRQRELVDELNESSIQYNILKREVDSNKEVYEGLLQRLKEAGVAAGLRSSNIRIADRAEVPTSRSSPRRTRTLVLATILGLFLGTGLVLLVEALDNSLKTTDDVSHKLGLPALGVVPTLESEETGSHGVWPLFAKKIQIDQPRLVYGSDQVGVDARALEAYRSLRTALLLSHSGMPPQVIMVTSAIPNEGKSTTVVNTAIALAQTGARTLIVDLDMRRSSIGDAFGIVAEQGMSTYLSGISDISSQIHETGLPNLFILPAGPAAPNPAELIGSEKMATGIQLLREHFDYVVIDSPPALELADALVSSTYTDGVILVARGGKTPRKAVLKTAEHLTNVGAKLLGVLINDVDVDTVRYGHYGYGGGARKFDRYVSPDSDNSEQQTA